MLALDCAATEFYKGGKYAMEGEGKSLDSAGMAKYLADLVARYPIVSIEDGMSEDDWAGWKELTTLIGKKCQLVGDDLFVTNTKRLEKGIKEGIGNSILVKVNQIGSLTETLDAVSMAQRAAFTAVISHRSRRDGRQHHRRHRGRDQRRPDQDRLAVALGSPGEIQPAHPHRGRAGRPGPLCRPRCAEGRGLRPGVTCFRTRPASAGGLLAVAAYRVRVRPCTGARNAP